MAAENQRLLFISGTRADFGKLKSLFKVLKDNQVEFKVFVTGMHLHLEYGETWREFEKLRIPFHLFDSDPLHTRDYSSIFANTTRGISELVDTFRPSVVVVHGDRLEALAGAVVGALENVRVIHIEGGEVSGTVDESLRHAVTKLCHGHLVSNEDARLRLLQMGEHGNSIRVIGSPELDAFSSPEIPSIEDVLGHYSIPFQEFALLIFHPVTTDNRNFGKVVKTILRELARRNLSTIAVLPNNDRGSQDIRDAYQSLSERDSIRIIPSFRFEAYVALLQRAKFIIGNSSSGVREAHFLGTPAVDIGDRQKGRVSSKMVFHATYDSSSIGAAIDMAMKKSREPQKIFGNGSSAAKFIQLIEERYFESLPLQKTFRDLRNQLSPESHEQ